MTWECSAGEVLIKDNTNRAVICDKISILSAIVQFSSRILQAGGVRHFTGGNGSIFLSRNMGVLGSGSR